MPVRSETKPWGPPVKSSPKFEEESEKKIDLEFYEDTLELWVYTKTEEVQPLSWPNAGNQHLIIYLTSACKK